MRKTLLLGVCAAVLVTSVAPAFAQQYPPPRQPTCNVSDKTVEPGQTVRIGGRRWKSNSIVVAGFHQKSTDTVVMKSVTTDSDGTWSTTITVPHTVENGPAVFGAKGENKAGQGFRCTIPVTVVGASAPTAATSAPAAITTGMLTTAMLLLGAVALFWRRSRRVKSLVA